MACVFFFPLPDSIVKKGLKENEKRANSFNINCKDPLGRTSLNIAIENENMDMIKMLLDENVAPGVSYDSVDTKKPVIFTHCASWN